MFMCVFFLLLSQFHLKYWMSLLKASKQLSNLRRKYN